MARDRQSIAEDIHRALEIPREEVDLYLDALVEGGLVPRGEKAREIAESLSARGMLVLGAAGRSYLAVHPRMALSNLFRAYEERLVRQRKEKRLLVDRLTLELMPLVPGESKGTKATAPEAGRTGTKRP